MPVVVLTVGDIIKVRQAAKNTAQYALNVMHYRVLTLVGTPVDVGDVAIRQEAVVGGVMKPLLANVATWWGLGATNLTFGGTPEYYANANQGTGTGGADLAPTQAAPLVSWRTGRNGPSGRGRTFLPFMPTFGLNADAALTTAYKTLIQDWIDAVAPVITVTNIAATGTATLQLQVSKSPTAGPLRYVDRSIIRPFAATQRRREELNRADNDPFAGSILVP